MNFLLFCLFFPFISFSQSLNYDYSVTFGNHVIAINEINYDFQEGDIIGSFFINEKGQLQCCGSTVYNNDETIYLSAWPDDNLTESQEGFIEGDELILALYLCDENEYISLSYNPFPTQFSVNHSEISYSSNGINIIDINLFSPPNCNSSIEDYKKEKNSLKIFDFLGRITDLEGHKKPYFILFDDGTVEKKFIIR